MPLKEKGHHLPVLLYGLFWAIPPQRSVRNRREGIPVTKNYYGLSRFSIVLCILLLTIGLHNATFTLREKGFYATSSRSSMFAASAVQKNTRDSQRPGTAQ